MYSEPHFNKRVLYSEGIIVSGGKEYRFSHKENEIFPYVLLQDRIKLLPNNKNIKDYIHFVSSLGRYKNKSGKVVSFDKKEDPYMKHFKLTIYNRFLDLSDNKLKLEKVKEYVYK